MALHSAAPGNSKMLEILIRCGLNVKVYSRAEPCSRMIAAQELTLDAIFIPAAGAVRQNGFNYDKNQDWTDEQPWSCIL